MLELEHDELGHAVNLVVMTAMGECLELGPERIQPGRIGRQQNKPGLDLAQTADHRRPEVAAQLIERCHAFPLRIEEIADMAVMEAIGTDRDLLVLLGDGRQVEMGIALVEQIGRQIILMQALLDGDNDTSGFVIEARGQSAVEPGAGLVADRLAAGIVSLHAVIEDDHVGAEPGDRAAERTAYRGFGARNAPIRLAVQARFRDEAID